MIFEKELQTEAVIYDLYIYKYIRVLFSNVKRRCYDSSIQGTEYMVFCRPAYRQFSLTSGCLACRVVLRGKC